MTSRLSLTAKIILTGIVAISVAAGAEATDVLPDVLVSENRSILRYESYSFWFPFQQKAENICTFFYVSPREQAVPNVLITSTGLGEASFVLDDTSVGGKGCPGERADAKLHLVVPNLDRSQRVLMHIPASERPDIGSAVEGKILIVSPKQRPVEVPIKIENPTSPFRIAWLWVWGIVIPGGITFGFGYLAAVLNNWLSTRRTDNESFRKYKDENYGELEKFFTGPYAVSEESAKDPKAFAKAIRTDLTKEKILAALPRGKRKRLEKLIRNCDRVRIKAGLIALFPEWEEAINAAKK